ncbi:Uncharacterized protein ABJ99_3632 [Pseudomonas syringae pv. cilantro]|uniref:Uncharacterized protein n=2 Tax=Pseudomonas syringae group TaxID=136849 RepID=A0A0N1JNF1_PSESX|nr:MULTISPECIES: hypothetical protein [Pseudomonas syringae group]KPC26872.1 Uncharacterized protein ABJ99_3632 [Pseudomonas syringae pv. cilantro]KPW72920.1 Uncharacterized protein ALO76_01671 [Pseudomonas syringae pv. coriandricola]RMN12554.1 hypothetical protein ALQ65_02424 [Pseudomonas syringae pv. coriandricola]
MSIEPQRQKEQPPGQHTPADQGPNRNDPAIERQVSDEGPETEKGDGHNPGQTPAPSQSQSQSQSPTSDDSAYVPDHEIEGEKTEDQRNHQQTQGIDADIDTQGG